MKKLSILLGAAGLVLMQPLVAQAARLSLSGYVELANSQSPVGNARVTVTFHGHEVGIHEYTTERTVRARTDELGNFVAEVKVPDRRYTWTHATVEISETDVSKLTKVNSACTVDGSGGCQFNKDFQVSPLNSQ
ncbi:MAG: hypothetical protein F6K42_07185 [Leptolyngbya sp. SIO1D8]|nr:hypothetical protein [Leptolyngbya sp. SIO1D8]